MVVTLNGTPVSKKMMRHIQSINFKDALDKLDSADVTIAVSEGIEGDILKSLELYGKEMVVELQRAGATVRTFAGDIMNITWQRSGGTDKVCTITAVDRLHRLKRGRPDAKENDRKWTGKKLDAIVKDVAGYWGLSTGKVASADAEVSELEWKKDDAQLLMHLAEDYNYTLRVDSPSAGSYELVFQKQPGYRSGGVTLKYGVHIIAISATHSLDGLLKEVTATGKKAHADEEPIVYTAKKGDVSPLNSKTGIDYLGDFKAYSESIEDESGFRDNQSTVSNKAKARLNEAADTFVSGQLTCRFLPEISCGSEITIEGAGWPLDGTFVVKEATHSLDGSGYRTKVTFIGNSIASP
jgi:phage protein D